ncbi:MarR family transcriptional regulator, partial [Ralstonia pseudosolanacearum]
QVLNRFFAGFTQAEVKALRGLLRRALDNGTDGARMRPSGA